MIIILIIFVIIIIIVAVTVIVIFEALRFLVNCYCSRGYLHDVVLLP